MSHVWVILAAVLVKACVCFNMRQKKERKKSQDFRVICVKSKSSLKLLMPSQSQVEFFISVSQVSLKSSNLQLESDLSQVM